MRVRVDINYDMHDVHISVSRSSSSSSSSSSIHTWMRGQSYTLTVIVSNIKRTIDISMIAIVVIPLNYMLLHAHAPNSTRSPAV